MSSCFLSPPASVCADIAEDISNEYWRVVSNLSVCGLHMRGLGLIDQQMSLQGFLLQLKMGCHVVAMLIARNS